ncbi:uncharacterized protein N0V89_008042 [Didymosphaeria variabile]|uniref:Uncharacterized protein n=1 Tax=Didymosphaeria variabile TaxID=1932322 RepID=A0A9W8XGV7_9PLEO|nr:uncharacterized protein N0V89_008042 [Didymosphaeria variabile]KAJ4349427.1 hypothetical protein N0V89_008042 [Didymosphaeria variabile]
MSVKEWARDLQRSLNRQTVYSRIHDDPSESTKTSLDAAQPPPPNRVYSIFSIVNVLLFLSSIVLVIIAYKRPVTDSQCVKQLYTWSPAFEAIEYHEEDYSGLFRQASAYRGKPTPELDEQWLKLWDCEPTISPLFNIIQAKTDQDREFDVPESAWPRMNRTADPSIVRTSKGGGAALFWGMHQLHCLVFPSPSL